MGSSTPDHGIDLASLDAEAGALVSAASAELMQSLDDEQLVPFVLKTVQEKQPDLPLEKQNLIAACMIRIFKGSYEKAIRSVVL